MTKTNLSLKRNRGALPCVGTEQLSFSNSSRLKTKLQALGQYAGEAMLGSTTHGEIERYLLTGESDPLNTAWPGGFLARNPPVAARIFGRRLTSAVNHLSAGRTEDNSSRDNSSR